MFERRDKKLLHIPLALLFLLLGSAAVLGDVLKLSPQGVTALKPAGIAQPLTDNGGFFVRGRIVVQRDANGKLTLQDPGLYFMFEPLMSGNKYGPAKQMRWIWVASSKPEIDTIEDLRSIVSNRDQKYGSFEVGLIELLKEIDKDDSIYHVRLNGKSPQPISNGSVTISEGWLTRNLLLGRLPELADIQNYMAKVQRGMPRTDPMSYRPNDPLLLQNGGTRETMVQLLEAIARAKKYGEPEKGFLHAALLVAKFISEDMYPAGDSHSGPSMDRAGFFLSQAVDARGGLTTQLSFVEPETLTRRLLRPPRPANSLQAKLSVERSYIPYTDTMPIDIFDVASAGVELMAEFKTLRSDDAGSETILRSLLRAASGRADFRAVETNLSFPSEVNVMSDALGKEAFDILVRLASDKSNRDSPAFRRLLVGILCDTLMNSPADRLGNPSLVAATTQATIGVGIGGPTEIVTLVDAVWDTGVASTANNMPWTDYAVKVLKGVRVDAASRAVYDRYLAKRISDFQRRQDTGNGSPEELEWLRRLKL